MSHFVLEVLRNTSNSTRAVITNPKGVVYKIILGVNTIYIKIGATDQGCGEGAMTIEIFLIMFGYCMTVLVIYSISLSRPNHMQNFAIHTKQYTELHCTEFRTRYGMKLNIQHKRYLSLSLYLTGLHGPKY